MTVWQGATGTSDWKALQDRLRSWTLPKRQLRASEGLKAWDGHDYIYPFVFTEEKE